MTNPQIDLGQQNTVDSVAVGTVAGGNVTHTTETAGSSITKNYGITTDNFVPIFLATMERIVHSMQQLLTRDHVNTQDRAARQAVIDNDRIATKEALLDISTAIHRLLEHAAADDQARQGDRKLDERTDDLLSDGIQAVLKSTRRLQFWLVVLSGLIVLLFIIDTLLLFVLFLR